MLIGLAGVMILVLNMTNKEKQRFWVKVEKNNNCWYWKAAKNEKGYGYFGVNVNGKFKMMRVNRLSWEIYFGKISTGLCVCHKCDNPICINPNHLFLGMQKDNIRA